MEDNKVSFSEETKLMVFHIHKWNRMLYNIVVGSIAKVIRKYPIATFWILLSIAVGILIYYKFNYYVSNKIESDIESKKSYEIKELYDSLELVHEADSITISELRYKLTEKDTIIISNSQVKKHKEIKKSVTTDSI